MEHPFSIGEIYANRKGPYEVVALNETDNEMRIRYTDTGDEQPAKISAQARIWNNMLLDEQTAERNRAETEARYQQGYGAAFKGLIASDFKTSIEGTSWRSRRHLGGLVALCASASTPYTFVSWSVYPWPVVFLTHRENYNMAAFALGSRKAKFTLEVDENFLYYGFYIERSDQPMDANWDWPRFLSALLNRPELSRIIEEVEKDPMVRFIGRKSTGSDRFHFANGLREGAVSLWDEQETNRIAVEHRIELLTQIPNSHWGEVYIIAQLPKEEAIALGVKVSEPIANLFHTLLPFYRAALEG